MTFLLPIVAALSAILILPGLSFYFDVMPKVVVILLGAGFVFLLRRRWPVGLLNLPEAKPLRYFTILAGAQALLTVLTTLTSTHPQLSILGSTWRRSGAIAETGVLVLAVAGAIQFVSDLSSRKIFLRITVLSSIPISIYGILQYFGVDPILASAGYHFGEGAFRIVRPPATLGHAAYFATYMLYVPFAGAALVSEDSEESDESEHVWKIPAIAASILAILAIVLSGTRAALLGFILGAIFVVLRNRPNWRFFAGAAALLLAVAALYASPAGDRLRARVFWASEDRFGGARLLLWRDSLTMSREHLLLGYGPESFTIEFPKHESIDLARQFPDFYQESAHNIFLDALTAKGIFGFAALAALTIISLAYARGPIGGAFVAMLVAQQFTTFTLPTELFFYLCAALIVSDFEIEPMVPARPQRWTAVFALLFLAMAIYLGAGDAMLAISRQALDQGNIDRAWKFQERARSAKLAADVYFARSYLAIPNQRARGYAMASALRATLTADDRQNALLNFAAFQSPYGDAAAVERTLRIAIDAAPNWYKPHWLLAQVLALEGRTAEAHTEAQAAIDRGGGRHPEVQATMDSLR